MSAGQAQPLILVIGGRDESDGYRLAGIYNPEKSAEFNIAVQEALPQLPGVHTSADLCEYQENFFLRKRVRHPG